MFWPQPHGDVAIDPLGTDDMTVAALSTTLMQIERRSANQCTAISALLTKAEKEREGLSDRRCWSPCGIDCPVSRRSRFGSY